MNAAVSSAQTASPLIQLEDLKKVFYTDEVETHALSGVHFEIQKGDYLSISGPSGCGKSTLLSILGLLDTPTDGHYTLGGEHVAGVTRDQLAEIRNRRVGFVFQNFNLLPHITSLENVEMPMLFGGMPVKDRRERATELLTRVGLEGRIDHKPTELSGGQMQRVAIARALAMNPDIILADEPTGNLDSHSSTEVMELLRSLSDEDGAAVVKHGPAGRTVTHETELLPAIQSLFAIGTSAAAAPAS